MSNLHSSKNIDINDDAVLEERLRQTLVQAIKTERTAPLGWALVAMFCWGRVPSSAISLWLTCFTVALVIILFSLNAFQKRLEDAAWVVPRYALIVGLDGLAWGLASVMLMGYDSTLDPWIATILCGVAAVNAPVHIKFIHAYGMQLIGIWIPTAIHTLQHIAEPDMLNLLVGMTLFLALLFFYMRGLGVTVNSQVALMLKNETLTEQLKEALASVTHDAETDALTGIANRRSLASTIQWLIHRAETHGEAFALLMLDIDHFKLVNDTYGHNVGDEALKAFAQRVAVALRPTDMLMRLGGEEFVVVVPSATLEAARVVAQRVCAAVSATPLLTDPKLSITVSIGVAAWEKAMTLEALLESADQVVYHAKKQGRNQVCDTLELDFPLHSANPLIDLGAT